MFAKEEERGLTFAQSLSAAQRELATRGVGQQQMDWRVQTAAFRDYLVLPHAGA